MIVDVVMPKMGESINEGTILEWRKEVGEKINLDEILLEIGTDKVDSEIPSSAAGTVIEILAEPNDVKEVGQVIARIDTGSRDGEERNDPSPVNEAPFEKIVKILPITIMEILIAIMSSIRENPSSPGFLERALLALGLFKYACNGVI